MACVRTKTCVRTTIGMEEVDITVTGIRRKSDTISFDDLRDLSSPESIPMFWIVFRKPRLAWAMYARDIDNAESLLTDDQTVWASTTVFDDANFIFAGWKKSVHPIDEVIRGALDRYRELFAL